MNRDQARLYLKQISLESYSELITMPGSDKVSLKLERDSAEIRTPGDLIFRKFEVKRSESPEFVVVEHLADLNEVRVHNMELKSLHIKSIKTDRDYMADIVTLRNGVVLSLTDEGVVICDNQESLDLYRETGDLDLIILDQCF